MNHEDLRKLREQTAAKASAIAKAAPARAAEPARAAKPASPAQPRPVPPKTRRRPALKAVPPSNVVPIPAKRLKVSDSILQTVRSRVASRRRQEEQPTPDQMQAKDLFKPAKPPPGVLPSDAPKVAMDAAPGVGWAGDWVVQAGYFEGMTFLGYPILAELANRTEYRKVSERLSTEMTRKWMELTSSGDEDKTELIKEIDDWLKEMKLREHAQRIAFVDGTMGRAHLFIDTGLDDPKELKTPLGDGRNSISLGKVDQKNPIKRLTVVEPTWTYPAAYNAVDPTKPDWLNPETWYCMAIEYHRSRLLPFIGRPVPDLYKPAFAFGGLSLSQMMKSYVDNWTSARQHISRLIGNFSRSGIKTDMQQQLAPSAGGSANGAGDLMNRVDLYNLLADNNGLMVLDSAGNEEFFQVATPLGTLDALQAQSLEQICLPAGMPVVVFLGLTPKGLNASSEGEIQAWEMWVNAYQEHLFGDMVRRMINFAQLSLRGSIDPTIGYKWLPLRTMSDKDIADLQKSKADRDVAYVTNSVLDPIEVRKALKADPLSGYTAINAEDAPEPPQEDGGEGGEEDDDFADLEPENDNRSEGGDRAAGPFARDDAKWEESKHPREPDGKFSSTGGGSAPAFVEAAEKHLADQHGENWANELTPLLKGEAMLQFADQHGEKPETVLALLTTNEKVQLAEEYGSLGTAIKEFFGSNATTAAPAPPPAEATKSKKTAFGGLYKTGATPTEAHQNTVKAVLANKKQVAGSSYRQMLAHLIKESPKYGTEAKVPALKAKLADTLMNAHDKLVKMAEGSADPAEAAKLTKMAGQAKQQADALFAESKTAAGPKPIDPTIMQKVSGQKGSNPGGVYKDGSGNEFYVKHLKSEAHKTSEYTAAALYKLAGINTLSYVPTVGNSVATKYVPLDKTNVSQLSPPEKQIAQLGFGVNAWLANWDAVGTGGDNIGVVKGDIAPTILDVGGSLGYRAQGEPKGDAFTTAVPELVTMRDPKQSPDAAKLYGDMSTSQVKMTVERVANVRDDDIRKVVKENGQPEALAEKLIARKFNMAQQYGLKVIEEQEDPEFAAKHPRNPDGTFKKGAGQAEPTSVTKEIAAKALKDNPALAAAVEKSKAASVPKATPEQIKKAMKSTPVPQSLLPNVDPKKVAAFNNNWSGTAAPKTEGQALAKISAFNELKAESDAKASEAEKAAKAKAEQEKAAAAEKAKQEKAEAAAKAAEHKRQLGSIVAALGCSPEDAEAIEGFVSLAGGSVEEALKKFKAYEKADNLQQISSFENAMIRSYTGSGYAAINKALRDGAWTVQQHIYANVVNKALKKLPAYGGTTVRWANLPADEIAKMKVGHVKMEHAFMSTSKNQNWSWGGGVKMVVTGKSGRDVTHISSHPGEGEVLYPARTFFKITKVDKSKGHLEVHMEEIEAWH